MIGAVDAIDDQITFARSMKLLMFNGYIHTMPSCNILCSFDP